MAWAKSIVQRCEGLERRASPWTESQSNHQKGMGYRPRSEGFGCTCPRHSLCGQWHKPDGNPLRHSSLQNSFPSGIWQVHRGTAQFFMLPPPWKGTLGATMKLSLQHRSLPSHTRGWPGLSRDQAGAGSSGDKYQCGEVSLRCTEDRSVTTEWGFKSM